MSVAKPSKLASLPKFLANRFRQDMQFSNIFTVDLVASVAYVATTVYFLREATPELPRLVVLAVFVALYVLLHIGKILLVIYLERRGGDAREFVGSDTLVTSGLYQWSRNPVYLISIVQSLLWSLALVATAAGQANAIMGYCAAVALFLGHFWGIDHLIIPNEEAALKQVHPEAFAAYAAKVRRWI